MFPHIPYSKKVWRKRATTRLVLSSMMIFQSNYNINFQYHHGHNKHCTHKCFYNTISYYTNEIVTLVASVWHLHVYPNHQIKWMFLQAIVMTLVKIGSKWIGVVCCQIFMCSLIWLLGGAHYKCECHQVIKMLVRKCWQALVMAISRFIVKAKIHGLSWV